MTVNNVDDEAPGSPPGVTAVWGTPSKVTVGWGAATDNAAVTGYKVYRDGNLLTTLGAAARSHVDPGVANQTPHTYGVTAIDAAGHESAPGEAVVNTGDDTPPSKPTAQVSLTAPDEATVEWTESTDNVGVVGYRVYRGSSLVGTVTDGSGSLVDDGLDDGVTYSYRVQAYDAAGNSVASDPVAVTTEDVTAPSTPLDLRASSATGSVALTWRAAGDNVGVTDYVVHRDGLPLVTLGGTATSYTDRALVDDTLHRYQVTARDAADNESAKSNEVARTLTDSEPPTAPTRLTGAMSGASVRLTWTAATDNVGVTGYTVYRGGTAIGTSTTPAYTDTTPLRGRASSYTVRARDAAGNLGPASSAVSVTVPADRTAPSSPGGLRATVGAAGSRQITVAWNASTDNVGVANYYLFRGNAKYRLLGNVTSFVDTGLTAGTRYTYKVYALDAAGNWSGSSGTISVTAR